MYLLLRGLCQDRMRKTGRRTTRSGPLPEGFHQIPDPGSDPSQAANFRDVIRTVRQGIAMMPSGDQSLLESLLLGGGTVRDVSKATGQVEGTLRVRFHRALQRLRQFCQHLHED
jgi:DNA-directed RNA polymerase specialized sigma24 family protein